MVTGRSRACLWGRRTFGTLAGSIIASLAVAAPIAQAPTAAFSLDDDISWARLESFSGWYDFYHPSFVLWSPKRDFVLVRTTSGDLPNKVVKDRLLLFSTAEIERYTKGEARRPPTPKQLVEQDIATESRQIGGVRWLDDRHVAFVAGPGDQVSQVYITDVGTGSVAQITHSPTDVVSFGVGGGSLVYYAAERTQPDTFRAPDNVTWLGDLIYPMPGPLRLLDLYTMPLAGGMARRIDASPTRLNRVFTEPIWVSPSGRFAITYASAFDWPPYWAEYRVSLPQFFAFTDAHKDPDTLLNARLQIIDLGTGKARFLMDAPSAYNTANHTPETLFWMPGETSIVVSNNFLPLQGVSAEERDRRRIMPAIAEVELATGAARAIQWEPPARDLKSNSQPRSGKIATIDWDASTRTLAIRSGDSDPLTLSRYVRSSSGWHKLPGTSVKPARGLSFEAVENMNQRQQLMVSLAGDPRSKRALFDPNPGADRFGFGKMTEVTWTDGNGLTWHGGLLLPRGYRPGQAYPLVVQTHGFDTSEFLINGPHHTPTATAARVLASDGFLVLQIQDHPGVGHGNDEPARTAEGYRAGIESMIRRGDVDASRIGIEAYSHTGTGVISLITSNPTLVGAADISDATVGGYIALMQRVNDIPSDQTQRDAMFGRPASYDADGIAEWMRNAPTYRLAKVSTAVRIESLHPDSAVAMWETYALMRYAGRASEFIHIPDATHGLFNPGQRLISQGGAVDWYRFWLQGYEDPDRVKSGQYARWEKLCDSQRSENPGRAAYCVPSRTP